MITTFRIIPAAKFWRVERSDRSDLRLFATVDKAADYTRSSLRAPGRIVLADESGFFVRELESYE